MDGQITNCGGFDGDDAVNASALLFGQGSLNSSHEHTVQFKNVGSGSPLAGVIDLDYVELDYLICNVATNFSSNRFCLKAKTHRPLIHT